MAATATAVYRVRPGGSDLNGGGFDPGIAGAGTDYSQQTTANVTVVGNGSYAGTSAAPYVFTDTVSNGGAGPFTAAHVGNAIWISSTATTKGTGYAAGAYFITGYNGPTSVNLDRGISGANTSSGINYRIGGAWASPIANVSAAGNNTTYIVPGVTVSVYGSGTDNPTSPDYTVAGGGFYNEQMSVGYASQSNNALAIMANMVGENGRPLIQLTSSFSNVSGWKFQKLYFRDGMTGSTGSNLFRTQDYGHNVFIDCVFDQNGCDNYTVAGCLSLFNCEIFNSYTANSGARSTRNNVAVSCTLNGPVFLYGCNIHDCLAVGVKPSLSVILVNCVVSNCAKEGIYFPNNSSQSPSNQTPCTVYGCTIAGNSSVVSAGGKGGIYIQNGGVAPLIYLVGNIIANHTGAGQYGIYQDGGASLAFADQQMGYISKNTFFNNTGNFYGIDASYSTTIANNTFAATQIFASPGAENYTPNSLVAGTGFGLPGLNRTPGAFSVVSTPYPGAIQPASAAPTYVINKITTTYVEGYDDAASV